jgi:hypothetical protein
MCKQDAKVFISEQTPVFVASNLALRGVKQQNCYADQSTSATLIDTEESRVPLRPATTALGRKVV